MCPFSPPPGLSVFHSAVRVRTSSSRKRESWDAVFLFLNNIFTRGYPATEEEVGCHSRGRAGRIALVRWVRTNFEVLSSSSRGVSSNRILLANSRCPRAEAKRAQEKAGSGYLLPTWLRQRLKTPTRRSRFSALRE